MNIGDRIKVITGGKYPYLNSLTGTVEAVYPDDPGGECLAVLFDNIDANFGHNCDGLFSDNKGAYVWPSSMEVKLVDDNGAEQSPVEKPISDVQRLAITDMSRFLSSYHYAYTLAAVEANVDKWFRNKQTLYNLLRTHPNWSERDMAVVLEYEEDRPIDISAFKREVSYLLRYAQNKTHQFECRGRSCSTCEDYHPCKLLCNWNLLWNYVDGPIVNDRVIRYIKEYYNMDVAPGTRVTRVFNKICTELGWTSLTDVIKCDDGTVENPKADSYDKIFARIADSLSPMKVKRKAVLSINIMDFLTMSHGTGWKSCHNVVTKSESGCYSGGTLSYATDDVTMIFYTVDADDDTIPPQERLPLWDRPKISREIFCFNTGLTGMQSRLYPQTDNVVKMNEYRKLVQCVLAKCLYETGKWRENGGWIDEDNTGGKWTVTRQGGLQYPDYQHTSGSGMYYMSKVFRPDDVANFQILQIGDSAYCIKTGEVNTDHGCIENRYHKHPTTISQSRCNRVLCEVCGEIAFENQMHLTETSDGESVMACSNCCVRCPHCGRFYTIDFAEESGNYVDGTWACPECIEDDAYSCYHCGEVHWSNDMSYAEDIEEYFCQDCADEYLHYCDECDRTVYMDGAWVGDEWICEDCLDDHYFVCNDCGEYCHEDDICRGDDDEYYCPLCIDNHRYVECDGCGSEIIREETCDIYGQTLCRDCIIDVIVERLIAGATAEHLVTKPISDIYPIGHIIAVGEDFEDKQLFVKIPNEWLYIGTSSEIEERRRAYENHGNSEI